MQHNVALAFGEKCACFHSPQNLKRNLFRNLITRTDLMSVPLCACVYCVRLCGTVSIFRLATLLLSFSLTRCRSNAYAVPDSHFLQFFVSVHLSVYGAVNGQGNKYSPPAPAVV